MKIPAGMTIKPGTERQKPLGSIDYWFKTATLVYHADHPRALYRAAKRRAKANKEAYGRWLKSHARLISQNPSYILKCPVSYRRVK